VLGGNLGVDAIQYNSLTTLGCFTDGFGKTGGDWHLIFYNAARRSMSPARISGGSWAA